MGRVKILMWILMIILAMNIAAAVSDTVRDSALGELEKEEDKREYIMEVAKRVNRISESKAVETMDDVLKRELNGKLAVIIGGAQTKDLKTLMAEISALEEEYGIQYRIANLAGRYSFIGGSAVVVLLLLYIVARKAAKRSKFLANRKLPQLYRSEKKKVGDIRELLIKKEPLIKENGEIVRQLGGEIEFFKELKEILVKRSRHFRDFKDWGALFDIKKLGKGDIEIMRDVLSGAKGVTPSITVNEKEFRGMEIFNQLMALHQIGIATARLLKNHEEIVKKNKDIVSITKSLMRFEKRYDRACRLLEIQLEKGETEMENFYKRFIVWKKREVIVDVEATKAKIDEHLKKLGADKDEGMKEFAEEAKKIIQAYHYKQQLINAIEGKVRADIGKGVHEFAGEKENIDTNNKIIKEIPGKLGHGKYDEIKGDIQEMIVNSNNIAGLYKKWELVIIKVLIDELKIQEEFAKLGRERIKELGGASKLAKDIMKRSPVFYGKEKEMDSIADDIKRYTKTFGVRKKGKLRDEEDLKEKIQFIIEEGISKSKKKLNVHNLDYLRDKINSFLRIEGARIFMESEIFKGRGGEVRRFSEVLATMVTKKIENMKGRLKK
ncbi:hypothetical protein KY345_05495 [Candidatus Woesearchaeota archaeon]|nr:hypothetical protein [Candidatus Woesearchaeota archaeon]